MKVFRTTDGRIVQMADKIMIEGWEAEMPLLFIGFIKEKRLPIYRKEYPKSLVKAVEVYLDEVLENVAIPKLISALSSKDKEELLSVAENIVKISESNPDQLKIALPHLEKTVTTNSNKNIVKLLEKAVKNYQKAQKRKQTAQKRKKLGTLRKEMDEVDRSYADGNLTDAAYLIKQKDYLKLKREIELAEELD